MNKWKFFGLILSVFILAVSCFKDEPKKEMMRAAGPWNIAKITHINYDTLGNKISEKDWTDLGVLILYHEDDFQFQDVFKLAYKEVLEKEVVSNLKTNFFNANIWWMSVGPHQFGFGNRDPQTGYVQTVGLYTVVKANNKKMEILNVENHASGAIKLEERWFFERRK